MGPERGKQILDIDKCRQARASALSTWSRPRSHALRRSNSISEQGSLDDRRRLERTGFLSVAFGSRCKRVCTSQSESSAELAPIACSTANAARMGRTLDLGIQSCQDRNPHDDTLLTGVPPLDVAH
eukprot:6201609-Pleurochrysis_carterae.AAC.2